MLTKLLPDQIAKFWDVIKYAIEESLPPIVGEHPDKMNRILTSLLCNKTECWIRYRKEDKTIFEGIALTRFLHDDASNTKNLLIYCLYGYDKTTDETWTESISLLCKYAKKHKCSDVVAYTDIQYMIDKAKQLGGEAKYTYVSFNVEKIIKKFN